MTLTPTNFADGAAERNEQLLRRLYNAFNARDIAGALSTMHPHVVWANGLDGGYVHGKEKVRDYWLNQWSELESHADLLAVHHTSEHSASVDVHLTAFGLGGEKLFDTIAKHFFELDGDLVRRFETSVNEERGLNAGGLNAESRTAS